MHFGDESSPELDIARLPTLKGSESSSEQDNSKRALKRKHLRVDCMFRVGENEPVRIRALIDTGAEVSLIRQGILPPTYFYVSPSPIRIIGPDDQRVQGGVMELSGQIEMLATDSSEGGRIQVGFPTELKEANIAEQVILSFEWLSKFKIDIIPWKHGLSARVNGKRAWIPGAKGEIERVAGLGMPTPHVNTLRGMRVCS